MLRLSMIPHGLWNRPKDVGERIEEEVNERVINRVNF